MDIPLYSPPPSSKPSTPLVTENPSPEPNNQPTSTQKSPSPPRETQPELPLQMPIIQLIPTKEASPTQSTAPTKEPSPEEDEEVAIVSQIIPPNSVSSVPLPSNPPQTPNREQSPEAFTASSVLRDLTASIEKESPYQSSLVSTSYHSNGAEDKLPSLVDNSSQPAPSRSQELSSSSASTNASSTVTTVVAFEERQTSVIQHPRSVPIQKLGKIPRKTSQGVVAVASSNDPARYEDMELLPMKQKYRSVEVDYKYYIRKRSNLEKRLNDLARHAHGKNIETDPNFLSLKQDKLNCDNNILSTKATMAEIARICLKKFDYTFKSTQAPQPSLGSIQTVKRAKMSTSTITPQPPRRREHSSDRRREESTNHQSKSDRSKYVFNLHDTKTWCESCDAHFETPLDYCKHLHKNEHSRNVKNVTTPWRSRIMEVTDRKKTYASLKSICARISNELETQISIEDLDKLHDPNLTRESYKKSFVRRERAEFDEKDPLFEARGWHFLQPIVGFYCKLCSVALCDQVEVNLHMRSYDHNQNYIKDIALEPLNEKEYRMKHEKSYRKKFNKSLRESIEDNGEDNRERLESTPLKSILKADTSRERDSGKTLRTSPSKTKASEARIIKDAPEIVAIGNFRSKPTALKRLRVEPRTAQKSEEPSEKRTKTIEIDEISDIELEDNDDEDNEQVQMRVDSPRWEDRQDEVEFCDEISLKQDHPDNPFPDLNLSVSGNLHYNLLKDPRLAKPLKVVVKKMKFEEFKDYLIDTRALLSRVAQLITKKEPDTVKYMHDIVTTKPTYHDGAGNEMLIDLEDEEETAKTSKGSKLNAVKSEKVENKSTSMIDDDANKERSISPFNRKYLRGDQWEDANGDTSDDKAVDANIDLKFLENFFVEGPKGKF